MLQLPLIWVTQNGLRPLDWTPLNLGDSIVICCVPKVLFDKLEMDYADMFVMGSQSATRGPSWKLFPRLCCTTACKHFFSVSVS